MASFSGWGPMKQLVNAKVPENTKPRIFNTSVDHTGCGERLPKWERRPVGERLTEGLTASWALFCVCMCVCVGRKFWSVKYDYFQ